MPRTAHQSASLTVELDKVTPQAISVPSGSFAEIVLKLIQAFAAFAAASALALPPAAQAQTANVALYGRLNLDFEFVSGRTCQRATSLGAGSVGTQTGANQSGGGAVCTRAPGANQLMNPTVNRVSSNSSRFGMRGTESLGGGLNAVFQIETVVYGDTGAEANHNIASRETFVGLQGAWGRVIAGKFLMPEDYLNTIFGDAPTFLTSVLSTADVWAYGNLNKAQGSFDARAGNSIRYDSPNWNGLTASLQYSTRDDSGNTSQIPNGGDNGDHVSVINHANVWGGNLIYNKGPIQLGFGFEVNNRVRNAFTASTATWTAPNLNDWDWTIAASYDFGRIITAGIGLQIGAVFEQTKYGVQDPAAAVGSSCRFTIDAGTCTLKRNFWGMSATVPIGAGKMYAFYGAASGGRGSAADGTSVGYLTHGPNPFTGSAQAEISYSYALSSRTTLYAGFVKLANKCGASYTFNINPYPIAVNTLTGTKPEALNFCSAQPAASVFGIVHLF